VGVPAPMLRPIQQIEILELVQDNFNSKTGLLKLKNISGKTFKLKKFGPLGLLLRPLDFDRPCVKTTATEKTDRFMTSDRDETISLHQSARHILTDTDRATQSHKDTATQTTTNKTSLPVLYQPAPLVTVVETIYSTPRLIPTVASATATVISVQCIDCQPQLAQPIALQPPQYNSSSTSREQTASLGADTCLLQPFTATPAAQNTAAPLFTSRSSNSSAALTTSRTCNSTPDVFSQRNESFLAAMPNGEKNNNYSLSLEQKNCFPLNENYKTNTRSATSVRIDKSSCRPQATPGEENNNYSLEQNNDFSSTGGNIITRTATVVSADNNLCRHETTTSSQESSIALGGPVKEEEIPSKIKWTPSQETLNKLPKDRVFSELGINIENPTLSAEDIKPFEELITKYSDIFSLTPNEIGRFNMYDVEFVCKEPDPKPFHVKTFPQSLEAKTEMRRQVVELLKQGLVVSSNSPYAVEAFLIAKKGTNERRIVYNHKKNKQNFRTWLIQSTIYPGHSTEDCIPESQIFRQFRPPLSI